ncbi:MAG: hypothetical protein H0U97_08470 [Gammaproteobacteria bacterium]|nr:hypothetical protein [Gammaproteobacteria bacterium]
MMALSTISMIVIETVSEATPSERTTVSDACPQQGHHGQRIAEHKAQHDSQCFVDVVLQT